MTSRIQKCSLVALALAAACAASTAGVDRSALFLSAAPPPAGRVCHPAANPVTLPSANVLIDSAAVVSGLKSGPDQTAGYALFSMQFDNQGHIVSIRTVETSLTPERRASVEQLTLNRVRVQPADVPWSIRLKVTTDTAPRVQVGRSELCPAVLQGDLEMVARTTVVTSGRSRGQPSPTVTIPIPGSPVFAVLVDSTGKLIDLKLTESSGQPDVDQQMQSSLRGQTFRPTLLDGAPILAWTHWPLGEQ